MAEHTCFPVDVDGVTARVHGDPDMSLEAQAALSDLIRAASELTAEMVAARSPEEQARIDAVRTRNRERVERLRRG